MPAVVYYISKVGRIEQGPDAGRYLRVEAEGKKGAYVARVANDPEFTDVVGDQWFAAIEDLPDYFDELGSTIAWLD